MKIKLYRSDKDKSIYGICGGIAELFSINSTLVRILFLLFWPVTVIVYLILLEIMSAPPKTL